MARYAPPRLLPKELDLATAFELTRKLVVSPGEFQHAPRQSLGKALTYWLWRLRGRPRPNEMGQLSRLADKYERDLAFERNRVAQLEQLTKQLQGAFERQTAALREQHERAIAQINANPALAARVTEAEERARLAENKVELLKDALEANRTHDDATDTRFRDAKRAFARLAHPDQGGRDAPDRQRLFVKFWPVLEKIERGE
ncbi:MAG: hypothetical protein H7Y60_11900 [Rhodospirillaceae bacterium]|nr:hypothetical protein [Rhodospirillales bacterium]